MCLLVAKMCVQVMFSIILGTDQSNGVEIPEAIECMFLFTLMTGLAVTVAICMLIYISAFFTLSPDGIRMAALCVIEFLSGAVIPLPFLPDNMRKLISLLPFASMQNVPLRIYSCDLSGSSMQHAVCLQLIWLLLLVTAGRQLTVLALRKVTLQGG